MLLFYQSCALFQSARLEAIPPRQTTIHPQRQIVTILPSRAMECVRQHEASRTYCSRPSDDTLNTQILIPSDLRLYLTSLES